MITLILQHKKYTKFDGGWASETLIKMDLTQSEKRPYLLLERERSVSLTVGFRFDEAFDDVTSDLKSHSLTSSADSALLSNEHESEYGLQLAGVRPLVAPKKPV